MSASNELRTIITATQRPFREGSYRAIQQQRKLEEMSQDVPLCPTSAADCLPSMPEESGDGLSSSQRAAIASLISGSTFAVAARAAGVDRRTLFRWRQSPAFQTALDQLSREALETTATRVRNLMLRATRVLSDEMVGPNGFGAAMRVANSSRLWAVLKATETRLDETAGEVMEFADPAKA